MSRRNNNKKSDDWDGVKRSAFEKKTDKNGSDYFKGWVLTKAGMIDITVFPNKAGEMKKTEGGRDYMYCLAICKNRYAFQVSKLDAYYYPDKQQVVISEVDVVCSLNTRGGKTANGVKVTGAVSFIDYSYSR
ncbi:hypothetical protein [Roseivirga thermotolerans]|uniref:Uncharacterized protein n=1 Tax=Roseivirga thermotolerans TaxID=1758176 RepID=A0ABQ3IB85_9BACT|nr:hypothetical protein [Roseivirga thermotolerans]GHE73206.1 hypothetical protein GCM10011340_32180 [Roseivirga thermotolerans]